MCGRSVRVALGVLALPLDYAAHPEKVWPGSTCWTRQVGVGRCPPVAGLCVSRKAPVTWLQSVPNP